MRSSTCLYNNLKCSENPQKAYTCVLKNTHRTQLYVIPLFHLYWCMIQSVKSRHPINRTL